MTDDEPQPPAGDGLAHDEAALKLRPWSAFAFPDYRLLWLASLAISLTSILRLLSSTVWIYEETGSAAMLGAIGAIQLIVQIPALLYGGSLADRVDRKRLMAGMQAATAATAALVAVLAVSGVLAPWHILATTAVTAVTGVISEPARSALTPAVVPRSHLMHAVTSSTLTNQVAFIVAPLGFAAVAASAGLVAAFVMVAVTAVPGMLVPYMIRASGKPAERSGPRRSLPREMLDGFHFVRLHPILPGLVYLDTSITVFSFYREALPALARGLYDGGPSAVGVLSSANSIGAAIGSFVVLFLAWYRRRGMLVLYASILYGILLLPFATAAWLPVGILLIALLGATDAVGMTVRQTTVQLTTPDEMLGRALSFFSIAAVTANNLGTVWVGTLTALMGAENMLLLGAALSMSTTWLTWRLVPGIRTYRYP